MKVKPLTEWSASHRTWLTVNGVGIFLNAAFIEMFQSAKIDLTIPLLSIGCFVAGIIGLVLQNQDK